MSHKKYTTTDFSAHIFWDVAIQEIKLDHHAPFIFERVMGYGTLQDWSLLKKIYGLPLIKKLALEARNLDDFSLAFLSLIFDVNKELFRCYKQKQLHPNLWSY